MKNILKDEEVFELAKTKVIAELVKAYEENIEAINAMEIDADVAFIQYRIGSVTEASYNEIKESSLERRTELQQKNNKILRDIKAVNEMICHVPPA